MTMVGKLSIVGNISTVDKLRVLVKNLNNFISRIITRETRICRIQKNTLTEIINASKAI